MAKGGRGGRRGGGAMPSSSESYSNAPNPYQIPNTLDEAIGKQGAPLSESDAWFDANPYFNDDYAEFSSNCQRCVFAYEMRRRGYNVEALPTYENDTMPSGGNWQKAMSGMTQVNVGKTTEAATLKNIESTMASWGEGSRGIIRMKWAGGNSGHVINCEYSNGKLKVYDVQSNKRTTGTKYLKEYLPYTTLSHTQLFRTDNATPTSDMRYMVKQK
jgi:hypothetical protein